MVKTPALAPPPRTVVTCGEGSTGKHFVSLSRQSKRWKEVGRFQLKGFCLPFPLNFFFSCDHLKKLFGLHWQNGPRVYTIKAFCCLREFSRVVCLSSGQVLTPPRQTRSPAFLPLQNSVATGWADSPVTPPAGVCMLLSGTTLTMRTTGGAILNNVVPKERKEPAY